jgi:hypothetical protein
MSVTSQVRPALARYMPFVGLETSLKYRIYGMGFSGNCTIASARLLCFAIMGAASDDTLHLEQRSVADPLRQHAAATHEQNRRQAVADPTVEKWPRLEAGRAAPAVSHLRRARRDATCDLRDRRSHFSPSIRPRDEIDRAPCETHFSTDPLIAFCGAVRRSIAAWPNRPPGCARPRLVRRVLGALPTRRDHARLDLHSCDRRLLRRSVRVRARLRSSVRRSCRPNISSGRSCRCC